MSKAETYIQFIINELAKGNVKHDLVLDLFLPKFALSRQTFDKYWKIANSRHFKALQEINEAKTAISKEMALNKHTDAIKTAIQQQIEISDKIDRLEAKRESGLTKDWKFDEGKVKQFERPLNEIEKSKLDDTILKYRAELNKMIGGYSATKIDHSGEINIPLINWVK